MLIRTLHHRVALISLAAMLAINCGCGIGKGDRWKFAKWDSPWPFGKEEKPDPQIPARLVTTWTEAVLNRPGQKPQRGFGGRLAFFKNDSQDPVRVEGQLVVYAFDETEHDPYRTEPTRRYVFPAEQFSVFESSSSLGPSYSVWLPWDEVGGPSKKVSLIARFEPDGGAVIVGEQTRHYLPGAPNALGSQEQQFATTNTGVRTVSYDRHGSESAARADRSLLSRATSGPAEFNADRLSTTTIPLPRKLSSAPAPPLHRLLATASPSVVATGRMSGALPSPTVQAPSSVGADEAGVVSSPQASQTVGTIPSMAAAANAMHQQAESRRRPERQFSAGYQSATRPVQATPSAR